MLRLANDRISYDTMRDVWLYLAELAMISFMTYDYMWLTQITPVTYTVGEVKHFDDIFMLDEWMILHLIQYFQLPTCSTIEFWLGATFYYGRE